MAMRSHRRAYSYSQGAGVAPFWKLGSNSSAVSSENINTSTLVRATPERRSTGKRTFSGKGYAAVSICKPAAVKFAVNEDPWAAVDTDMSLRPRSPTKSRPGYSEMQQLDQSLAFIREQLMSLKSERTQLTERLGTLITDISRTEEEIAKKQALAAAAAEARRRSPGTPLRRIQSLEHKSSSRIITATTEDSTDDLFDDLAMQVLENSDSNSGSLSSVEGSPVFPARRHCAGSSQSLPRSYSPRMDRRDSNTSLSPQSPDGSLPRVLVAPRRSHSMGRRGSGSSGFQRTPSPFSQLEEIKEGESSKMMSFQHLDRMTTARDSISGSLLSLPQCVLSPEHRTCPNGLWDTHSVIMRVSSATGQLEEVPSHSQTLPKLSPKLPKANIMNLSEEPVSGRRRESSVSIASISSSSSIKRRSIVLDSIVTDV